jgi:glycosyltransferase involved in cell wall biosynthesis
MSTTERGGDFSGGDTTSRYLLDLTADRAVSLGGLVPGGLVEAAQRHGLIPLLSQTTDDSLVKAIRAREHLRSRVLEANLSRILGAFREREIRVAVLKGPAIALRYRDPTLRPFSDIDLLVADDEVERAIDTLAEDPSALHVPKKRPKADKRDVLFSDERGIRFNVDLHWDLFSYSQLLRSANGATEAAWSEATFTESSPLGPVWDIPDTYRVAFLAAHAVLDHRFRLILFRDFLELQRGPVDWDALVDVAGRWGLRSTTYLALWISKAALGLEVPDGVLESLRTASLPVRYLERSLPRVDLISFDGHKPHPVNLAAVLLNDDRRGRVALALRAPSAFPRWRQRVTEEHHSPATPRTLIVASTDRRRGAEVFTERLREGLTSRGWVVEAVSLKGYGDEPRADLEPLVDKTVGSNGRFELDVARALRAKITSFKPDVVVANGGSTLRYAVATTFRRRPHVVYIGIGEPRYWIRSRLSKWLNRLLLRRVDHVLAVSTVTRGQLAQLEPSLSDRISTTFTGVPDDLFQMSHTMADGPLRVLMIGSLTDEKDPTRALRVVEAVDGATLRFVGSGPLLEKLRHEAQLLGVADRVEFVGSVMNVGSHLAWAHVLILTSRSEGLPGAILEAAAAAVPTVAVDVGGVRDAVIDGRTGFVSDSDDELAAALRQLDSDREMLNQMGNAAREHAAEKFDLDKVIDDYVDVLSRVGA